tara:strand:+ start:3194 stop:3913 length:720 start_codon:yes stop_codon:yes gene_type:complete
MSVMAVEFDVEKLIGELNIIEKSQLPFAANQALKRFGYLFKTQLLPNKFNDEFNAPDGYGKPVPRTLNAVQYEADGMTLRLSFKKDSGKGLSPAEYLRSALYGGEATNTSIHAAIQKITGMYPVPAYGNLRALGALTQGYDLKGSYAARVISGLERNYVRKQQPASGERFVASLTPRGGLKGKAVYRVKGNSIATVFNLFDNKTVLDPVFKYEEYVKTEAEQRLPSLIALQLQRAMGSR